MRATTISSDAQLVEVWLQNRPESTRRAYEQDVARFRKVVGKELREVDLVDLSAYVADLGGADSTRARRTASVKSLLAFAHRVGYLGTNLGALVRTPKIRSSLHERILDAEEVAAVIKHTRKIRDHLLLKILYLAGLRIAEAVGLRWCDLGARWLTVRGKGGRTRTVAVPEALVDELRRLRQPGTAPDAPVFLGRGGRALSTRQARSIITQASDQSLGKPASPHWFRHAHATNALEAGAPLHLVQQTLGHASLTTTAKYLHVRPGQGSCLYLGTL